MAASQAQYNNPRDLHKSKKEKVLIILTNEAFIPSSSSSSRAAQTQINPAPQQQKREDQQLLNSDQRRPQDGHRPHQRTKELEEEYADPRSQKQYKFTGIDLVEVGYLWQALAQKLDIEVDFASPRGGPTAADPNSMEMAEQDHSLKNRLKEDRELINLLGHTYPVKWVDPSEYAAVIVPGSHGAMLDLPDSPSVERVLAEIYYEHQGTIATIGHGTAALLNVHAESHKQQQSRQEMEEEEAIAYSEEHRRKRREQQLSKQADRSYLIQGKRICCFSEHEEKEAQFLESVPYSLERKLRERGAKVENSQAPFEAKVVEDERLITGQNAKSIKEFVSKVAKKLGKQEHEIRDALQ